MGFVLKMSRRFTSSTIKIEQVQDFSSGRDLAPMAFAVKARGMTTLYDAILEAVKALTARQETRKAIVVLSDGMDTYSKSFIL